MECDLISAGPSAKFYVERELNISPIRVGVNSAGLLFNLDYLVILDKPFYELHRANFKGNPTIVTCGTLSRHLDRLGEPYFYTKYGDIPIKWKQIEFSYLAALYFCKVELAATKINIFGNDRTGINDCSGQQSQKGRSINRWQKECEMQILLENYITMDKK